MSDQEHLIRFRTVLSDIVEWLQEQKTPGIVIGGVDAGILGRPRATADIDISVVVDDADWPQFVVSGAKHGFVVQESGLAKS